MGKRTNSHGKRKSYKKAVFPTPDKGTAVQRKHKDTLFRFIFRDKNNLLQLSNALNQSDSRTPDELVITPVETT